MFAEPSGLILLMPVLIGLFILVARIDLFLLKRRNQIAHARYLASQNRPN
jgi:hypothetical protein